MRRPSSAEEAFRTQLVIVSLIFALFFIALLSVGGYIIIKDLGEKEVFRVLDNYRRELEKMTATIPETETAKGFKYEKIVTTRLNQFMVDKKIFDSFELYDAEGRLINQQDYFKEGGLQVYNFPNLQNPPLGKAQVEIRNKVPIAVDVKIAPGKMGKAVLRVSDRMLEKQAQDFRNEMIMKFSILLSLIFFTLLVSYLYVLKLLRTSRSIQKEAEEQNRLSYLGLLSSGLAHEIKNPLNSLKLNVQLLEEGIRGDVDRSELLSSVEPMLNQVKRLEKLTRDFLMYARPLAPEFKPSDMVQITRELFLAFSEEAREKGVELETYVEGQPREVPSDENMVRIIISNLLLNAIQASPAGEKVSVKLSFSDSRMEIDVTDKGGGICEESRERIFDIFFTTKPEGTGLGLSIVKRLTEAHGGTISLVEEPGGAHFKVVLPYVR